MSHDNPFNLFLTHPQIADPTPAKTAHPLLPGPELLFGLVGALGADLHLLGDILKSVLTEHTYGVELIRFTSILKQLPAFNALPESPIDKRIEAFMAAGTRLREETGQADAMAVLGVQQVRKFRASKDNASRNPGEPLTRQAYVFHSLKRPEEIDTLRRIYGHAFFVIGGYSPRDKRKRRLGKLIADSHDTYPATAEQSEIAERLILRDEHEKGREMGQDVTHAFAKADVFVNVSENESEIREQLARFVQIVFGYQFHTPTPDENGMFHAAASALRSAEMGRQVGAAISRQDGDIISLGTNDVPTAGGGLYWPSLNGSEDNRDFQRGEDTSDVVKKRNLAEVLGILRDNKLLTDEATQEDFKRLLTRCIPLMKPSRIMNSTEFGRAVHAEMDAIIGCARRGISPQSCTLYVTTFPCHNCTRHIVAAGLSRVVFIEPYAKSLASDLHDDSISVEGELSTKNRVNFVPFVGIAPHRYIHLFQMEHRKKDGRKIDWDPTTAQPRIFPPLRGYTEYELEHSGSLSKSLDKTTLIT
jgi:deoxycytidylate deaminase